MQIFSDAFRRATRRIWESPPAEKLRQALIGYPRQISLYSASMIWLWIIALSLPHGILEPEEYLVLWSNKYVWGCFAGTWLLIIVDSLIAFILAPVPKTRRLQVSVMMNCCLPMARIMTIPASPNWHVWLPFGHWQRRRKQLTKAVEENLLPWMMGITLLILPVLGYELLGFLVVLRL